MINDIKRLEIEKIANDEKVMDRDEFIKFVLSLQEEPEEEKEEI